MQYFLELLSKTDSCAKAAWLSFMMADIARLMFSSFSFSKLFDVSHRSREHSTKRIVLQSLAPNFGYILSLCILYVSFEDVVFLILLSCYSLISILKAWHQAMKKNAYTVSNSGHDINNFIVKPLRMAIVLLIAWRTLHFAWIIGFSIIFVKWIMTISYEKYFDVPLWYHAVLIFVSNMLVLLVYPFDIGEIKADYLRTFFSAIPAIYIALVGFLGVLYQLILNENGKKHELRQYVTWGIMLNFSYTFFLTILCLVGIISFGDEKLSLASTALFNKDFFQLLKIKFYLPFGLILSLGWFLSFFLLLNTYLLLQHTGMFQQKIDPLVSIYSKIKAMNFDGLTYQEIAECLNRDGIKLSENRTWNKYEVKRLVKKIEST